MASDATLPQGAFVIEAAVRLAPGSDPAAIGAAVTAELCGHWEHEGPCRWPHHTEVVEVRDGVAQVRTVAVAGPETEEAERRIRLALAAGALPVVRAAWSIVRAERVPFRLDEIRLADRIARPGAGPFGTAVEG